MKQFLLLFSLLLITAGTTARAQEPQPTPSPEAISDAQKRQQSFEIVWNTVNERFYDPTFGGVDWKKVRERYAPLVTAAPSDQAVHALLQQMIGELHQSHFVIIPKEAIPKLLDKKNDDSTDGADEDEEEMLDEIADDASTSPLDRIGYKLSERLSTGIGIDIRIIKGAAVITQVEPGSAAARAGLRPGFVIQSVGRRQLTDVIVQYQANPTFQSVFRGELPLILLAGFINGERRSAVNIVYLDGRNRPHTVRIMREKLSGEMSRAIGNLPAMYTEFAAREVPGGFAYIRFNAFMPNLMKKVCAALRAQHDARGLILDLRGNQGGLLGMIGGLSGLLQTYPVSLGVMKSRGGQAPVIAYPQRSPFSGPLVILIDGATQSAAEMFASGMQESGRATVIGEQSAGNTLPSAIMKLPTGALFQYGFADYETLFGERLEGHGITPDVTVALSRRSLLAGPDPQLAVGIRKIRELAGYLANGSPRELIADVTVTAPPPTKTAPPVRSVPAQGKLTKPSGDEQPPPPAPLHVATPASPASSNPPPPKVLIAVGEPPTAPPTGLPSIDQIIEHYLEAIGGRAALQKLSSRVSLGKVELQSMGLSGTAEIYEQAPNKSTMILNVEGLGTIQQTFDGASAWMQDPLDGYVKFAPTTAARLHDQAVFQRELRIKELNPVMVLMGKGKVGEREVFVVAAQSSRVQDNWYFDTVTGLLLRKGSTYYDDYREVDGVRLPFKITEDSSAGFGVVVSLSEIKHNVAIDQAKFAEYPDCFTRPEQDWTKK